MAARLIAGFVLAATFAATALADDVDAKRIEELWKKGSEWQVGEAEHIKKVGDAKLALIAAGEPALKHALTRLVTTDGLEIRCLDEVLLGLKEKSIGPLIERVGDKDVNVRRNVGRILGSFNAKKDDKDEVGIAEADIRRISAALLVQNAKEDDPSAKYWQLIGPARWKDEKALPLIIELSKSANERVRVRSVALLGNSRDHKDALARFVELLNDDRYFVRDAAADELKKSGQPGAQTCQDKAVELNRKDKLDARDARLLRLLMTIIGANNVGQPAWELAGSLGKHEDANVRGDSYTLAANLALQDPKQAETSAFPEVCKAYLEMMREIEINPYAKACLEAALERVK
ncbi:MAG: HEAT repeat domain-containing protein [Planctomycetes bacterium]|nr:HEAT repeat domain-containing protein [Planctomycetota bacterium]